MSTEATEAARKYDTEEKRRDIASHYHGGLDLERSYASALADHAAPLEDEVAKLRALVQALVDGIETMRQGSFADKFIFADDADLDAHADRLLAAAKEQGFTPTKPIDQ